MRDGRVVAVGSEGRVHAAMRGQAEAIDLKGRAVIPALTDAHVHLIWYALGRRNVQLNDVADYNAALQRVVDAAARLPKGAWVQGNGWDHTYWGERWPRAADLDARIPDRPVLLTRKDGHSAWVNSRALELASITDDTPDPAGGRIQREAGKATGMLFESAIDLVRHCIPELTEEERLDAVRDAIAEAHSYGMVGMHIPPGLQPGDGALALSDLQKLRARNQLPLRCLVHLDLDYLDEAIKLGLRSGLGDRWIKLGGVKMFADGSLGSETAEMLAPYRGRGHFGIATMPTAELNEAVSRAIDNGISVIIHAIGDAANRRVLNAIEAALQQQSAVGSRQSAGGRGPTTDNLQQVTGNWQLAPALPNRIEHVQVLDSRDVPRLAQLGVIASMQPVHATADMDMAEQLWGARCALAYAWRTIKDTGAVLAFGSDAPVEALNPWLGIHAAVTRQRPNGAPPDGWYAEQRLSLDEAIHGFTAGAACAAGEDHRQGMLKSGMLADLAVLNVDPGKLSPADLHSVKANMTMLEGEIVWERR